MAEEFHTGVCSGSWWNASRGGFDGPPLSAAASASCSAAASDVGSFGWAVEMMESKARSSEESAATVSGSSALTLHGTPGVHASDAVASGGFLMEPTSVPVAGSGLASPSMDWSQAVLRSNRRIEGGFQAILHDQLSSRAYLYQENSVESDQVHKGIDNSGNSFKDFDQGFMTHQPHLNTGSNPGDGADTGFQGVPFACSSTLLHDLLDQDIKPESSAFDARSTSFMSTASYQSSSGESSRFPQFLKAPPLKHQRASSDHLQFCNDTPFWNASAAAGDSMRAGFCSSTQTQFFPQQAFEEKPSHSSSITAGKMPNSEGVRDSATAAKKSANEPAFKKPRIETPSPLPTFKVRKERLGDRITALQQLVSPFGKTDTASVLHEAIVYIKFLHEQVGVLSTPYLKNGPAMQHQRNSDESKDGDSPKQDLSSRGLCLVPISITLPVVSEATTADFWTPSFGGTYR